MSLLALSNLTIRYGRLTAVRNVTFTLTEGEILFITGPNGAGKSSPSARHRRGDAARWRPD